MLKSTKKSNQKPRAGQQGWVIKNNLSEQEMSEAGERWLSHQGPYMTLAETLAYAAERDKQADKAKEAATNEE